jgi:hypothetical protein
MAIPTTTFHPPGPTSVKIPEATGDLWVEFSRNPAKFNVNQYVQWVPDSDNVGYFAELDTDEAVRVLNDEDYQWPDGTDRPRGDQRGLRWIKYLTERKAYDFWLGQKTIKAAKFDVVSSHARMAATKAMTARTYKAVQLITTAGNWPTGSKAATVDALLSGSGLNWIASTTSQLNIQKSFHTVIEAILKNTGGVVGIDDIQCTIGPDIAHQMARTAEIRAYLVNHEQAIAAMGDQGMLPAYNLPRKLYGVNMVVEDAVRVTTRKGVSQTRDFMMGNNAVFSSRVGGLIGTPGPNFSTIVGFVHEDMTVETETDSWNRRIMGSVVDDLDVVLAAPISGYHVADVTT